MSIIPKCTTCDAALGPYEEGQCSACNPPPKFAMGARPPPEYWYRQYVETHHKYVEAHERAEALERDLAAARVTIEADRAAVQAFVLGPAGVRWGEPWIALNKRMTTWPAPPAGEEQSGA